MSVLFPPPPFQAGMCWVKLNVFCLENSLHNLSHTFGNISSNRKNLSIFIKMFQELRFNMEPVVSSCWAPLENKSMAPKRLKGQFWWHEGKDSFTVISILLFPPMNVRGRKILVTFVLLLLSSPCRWLCQRRLLSWWSYLSLHHRMARTLITKWPKPPHPNSYATSMKDSLRGASAH